MQVINELIAVTVPRGAEKFRIVGGTVAYDKDKTSYYEALPFPAEIIGLASEVEGSGRIKVVSAAAANIAFKPDYDTLIRIHSLHPTPDNEIIFLKRK